MGNYVLYLLMQAFVTLIFAYFSGTWLLQSRRLHMMLLSLGFYLLMGSALLELWGDRAGWESWALGLNAALVATSVALMGAGALLREAPRMTNPSMMELIGKVFAGAAVLMGVVLAALAGSTSAVVGTEDTAGIEISGAFDHLGALGWALGSPLFIGAILLAWLGVRSVYVRSDTKGLWSVGTGVLFLLWPFDIRLGGLPLAPSILMIAVAMAYFGLQPPKGTGDDEEGKKGDQEGEHDGERFDGGEEGPAPWVMEAIAAKAREDGEPDSEE